MTLVSRVFANRYEILRELAQGGMAEVYLARDRLLARNVALKALFPEFARDPSFVERFRREAQSAAALNHPNIVGIHDWGQEDGTYFIVMEYVEGRTLRDILRSEGPVEPRQASEIAAEIASALSFAHRAGVVHRDVKPGNVLITTSGGVKVTDFGIARHGTSEGLTQTGSVMGTATYFSPEQAQGLPVDGRSDVYSLGVVLYEMVTGVAPFTGDSPVAVAYKHVRETPLPPSRRNADLPADLEQIILTAMAKDPDHRYQSADDMRADLLRFRRGRALSAAPITAIIAETAAAPALTHASADVAATVASPRVAGPDATQVGVAVAPGRGNGGRILATVLTLLVLGIIIWGVLYVSGRQGADSDKAEVRNVVGLDLVAASRILRDDGFDVKVVRVANDKQPADEVLDQSPDAGTLLKKGETVKLTVSTGSGSVDIPEVTGRTAEDARVIIEGADLVFEARFEVSDFVDPGDVIRTEPDEGTSVPKGSTVIVYVSSGPDAVPVPNVLFMDATEASNVLFDAGFRVHRVDEASDVVDEGSVIRTEPAPNVDAPEGSVVELFVSLGRAQIGVPNVVGKTEADAIATLEDDGFDFSVVYEPSTSANEGRVIDQDPAAGDEYPAGTTVVITVGIYEAPATTTSTTAAAATTTTTTAP